MPVKMRFHSVGTGPRSSDKAHQLYSDKYLMTYTTSVAIRVRGLGKCHQIYDQPQDRLKQSLLPAFYGRWGSQPRTTFTCSGR